MNKKDKKIVEIVIPLLLGKDSNTPQKYQPEFYPYITYESGAKNEVGLSLSISQCVILRKKIDEFLNYWESKSDTTPLNKGDVWWVGIVVIIVGQTRI